MLHIFLCTGHVKEFCYTMMDHINFVPTTKYWEKFNADQPAFT